MENIRYLLVLLLLYCFTSGKAQVSDSVPAPKSFLNLSFIGILSTNGRDYQETTNNVSIGLIYGGAKNVHGFSLSPFNYIGSEMYGLQVGVMNGATDVKGVQIGLPNVAKTLKGMQIGLVNDAETLAGVQIGMLNIAGQARGTQIGVVNVANHSDYPIGLINIIKSGSMSAGMYTDEMSNVVATFRSGGRRLYGIVGIGYSFGSSLNHMVFDIGLGAHFHLSDRFRIDTEVSLTTSMKPLVVKSEEDIEEKKKEHDFKIAYRSSIRILPNYRFGKHIELFAGPTVNYLHSKHADNGRIFPSHYWWREFESSSRKQIYLGWIAGAQYKF